MNAVQLGDSQHEPLLSVAEGILELDLANSYTRLDRVLDLYTRMDRGDWFELLGEAWSICDNIGARRPLLRQLLAGRPRDLLDRMMTAEERIALSDLPERIQVWRGCYEHNVNGLSWSTDRDVAEKFPFLTRYRAKTDPLLVSGWTRREKAVLKLDRGEQEIIATRVTRTSIEVLPEPPPG